jgi:hypothetical protein
VLSASPITELNDVVSRFCENPALLEEMRLKAQEISRELSPDSIVQLADRLVFNYSQCKKMTQTL